MDSVEGSKSENLAFEIRKEWEGAATVRVGNERSDDLNPGRQIVTVDADGEWEITFLKEG